MQQLRHIFQLGIKELLSLFRDPVLLFLIFYSFTFSVYTPSKSAVMDVINASVAVVDEDHSAASRQIRDALLPPLFLPAAKIPFSEINQALDEGIYTFVIDIPPKFQRDLTQGVAPLRIDVFQNMGERTGSGAGSDGVAVSNCQGRHRSAGCRLGMALRGRIGGVSLLRYRAGDHAGHPGALDAPVRTASLPGVY